VCALDHPAAEKTPFGQAVTKKAAEGGGWKTNLESKAKRNALEIDANQVVIVRHLKRRTEIEFDSLLLSLTIQILFKGPQKE